MKKRKASSFVKLFLLINSVSLGLLCILGWLAYKELIKWSDISVELSSATVITFPRGTSLTDLSKKLKNQGVVDRELFFTFWVRYFSDYSRFQAGNYRFSGKVSPQDIARTITKGLTYTPVVVQFTVPEGYNIRQIARLFAEKGIAAVDEILALAEDRQFISEQKIIALTLEGYLFPATYPFSRVPTAKEALTRMVNTFWQKLPADYQDRAAKMKLSLQDAVTFASLIELETPHDDERPMISEVIWRRLRKDVPLGIDAALIYGIKDYHGNITRRHLKDRTNPYNSRIHKGLPPTPICSPSLSSLLAVLSPTEQGYYYYVLDVESDDGTHHHFSRTLKEHNKYVRKLVKARRKARKKHR